MASRLITERALRFRVADSPLGEVLTASKDSPEPAGTPATKRARREKMEG